MASRQLGVIAVLVISICAGSACGGKSTVSHDESDAGSSAGSAGAFNGGAAGHRAVPATDSGVVITEQATADKVDLLFMVDNSVSMADKQEVLREAVPALVSRFVDPRCADTATGELTTGTSSRGCPSGSQAEFDPISDIHIGIVSSSLGAHGGTVCAGGASTDTLDDKAHLIGAMRPPPGGTANPAVALNYDPARTLNGLGFLAWDPLKSQGGNVSDVTTLNVAFQDMIIATGEHGCGYEASLESWYRFLVDPEPPANVSLISGATVRSSKLNLNKDGTPGVCDGCDDVLLAQRKAFLRPDSLVAIVMLSDENDCSIRDDGVGWFVGASARMPRSTAVCDTNPNDPCCRSCAQRETSPPFGCAALTADPVCKTLPAGQQYATWDTLHDSLNLRCYDQRNRFGFELLYETQRYVSALTSATLPLQSNPALAVANPLFYEPGSDMVGRGPSLVFLAGIVGVPWQDLADDASLTGAGLNYLSAAELVAKDRWSALLGDPTAADGPVPPSDPFMIETTEPRSGMNTIAKPPVAISPATSTDPHANAINGHEQNIPLLDDLQYACTFPLKTPKTCANGDSACDCSADKSGDSQAVMAANSPLCQGGATINTQTSAKAYPGTRELQVLKDLGDAAITTSICPKVTASANPSADANYGYNPAVSVILQRLRRVLKGHVTPN